MRIIANLIVVELRDAEGEAQNQSTKLGKKCGVPIYNFPIEDQLDSFRSCLCLNSKNQYRHGWSLIWCEAGQTGDPQKIRVYA